MKVICEVELSEAALSTATLRSVVSSLPIGLVPDRIYADKCCTGRNRERLGLREARRVARWGRLGWDETGSTQPVDDRPPCVSSASSRRWTPGLRIRGSIPTRKTDREAGLCRRTTQDIPSAAFSSDRSLASLRGEADWST